MKSKWSQLNIICEGIIPLLCTLIIIPLSIYFIMHIGWLDTVWGNILLVFFMLDILFMFAIYPLAVFVKCISYDRDTVLRYDIAQDTIYYERKDIIVQFSLSEIQSIVIIQSRARSVWECVYEIKLYSGYVISVTDLIADTKYIIKAVENVESVYENLLFNPFYNKNPHVTQR